MFKKIISKINNLFDVVKLKSVDLEKNEAHVETSEKNQKKSYYIQQFGFASYPPIDSDLVSFNINGDINNSVVFASTSGEYDYDSLRIGDVIIYDNDSNVIKLSNGTITIESKNTVYINANLEVKGNIKTSDDVVAGSISLKNHTHGIIPNSAKTEKPLPL